MRLSSHLHWHLRNGADLLTDSLRYILLLLVLLWLLGVALSIAV